MKNKIWLAFILLFALVNIYLFWPGNLYFLNDDLLHIPLTDKGKFFQTNSVRPIHELLVRLDLFLWNKKAFGYHITALLLHFLVCFQLFDLCLVIQLKWLKIEREQAFQAGFLATILFLVYPQSSESLAWIIGRAPILSAIFLLITVRLVVTEKFTLFTCSVATICFALTLFTYEQSLLFPLALLWVAGLETNKIERKKKFAYVFLLLLVMAGYIIVRKLVTSEVVGSYEAGNFLSINMVALGANFFRIIFRLIINPAYKIYFVFEAFVVSIAGCIVLWSARKAQLNKGVGIFFCSSIFLLIAPVVSLGVAVNSYESGRYLYLPSLFMIVGFSIATTTVFYQKKSLQKPLIAILFFVAAYWLSGKYTASKNYTKASSYVRVVENSVQQHFKNSQDTMYIDTLRVTVNRLPVFRLGFKTGINWLNNSTDTSKIVVRNYVDESANFNKKRTF